MTASCHWSSVKSHWTSTMKRVQHDEIRKAHICDIWALLIILLSVAVIFAVSILQGVCIARWAVIGQWSMVIGADSLELVEMGGVS